MFVFFRIVGDRRVRGNREKSRNLPGTLRIRSRQNSRYQKCWLRHKVEPFLCVVRSLMVGSSFQPKDALFSKGVFRNVTGVGGVRMCSHFWRIYCWKQMHSVDQTENPRHQFVFDWDWKFQQKLFWSFRKHSGTSESHVFVMNRSLVQRHSLSFLLLPLFPFLFPSHVVRHQGSLGTVLVI